MVYGNEIYPIFKKGLIILKNWKRMIFSALTIVLAVAVSGCNMVQVNEEKDRKIVVAKVNGTEIQKECPRRMKSR